MRNYIFDLDGTLVNSSEEVLLCFKKAFDKAGYKAAEDRLNSNVIGPPLKGIIELIAPELTDESTINKIVEYFRGFYDYDEDDISFMYDGAYDLLVKLKNEGKNLFIATYKPEIPTMRIVKKFGLDMFKDIYTIDKFGEHITKEQMINDIVERYNLEKSETVMIGDAPSDVISAKNAGVTAIGALWGYGTDKTQVVKNSDYTFSKIEEIGCLKLNSRIS